MQRRQNPMCYVFPRIVSCDYHRFGTGGEQENLNSICILALNIINDKVFLGKTFLIYNTVIGTFDSFKLANIMWLIFKTFLSVVLWWWFILLIFLGLLRLIFRIIQVNSVRLRYAMLNLRMHR